MGNLCPFQIQCGDSLINHCWDCTEGQAAYIYGLEDNFEALKTVTQELRELKDDVIERLRIEEGRQMKRLQQVQGWLSRVEAKLTEVDELIGDGPREIEKLCLGGCCSKNCKSSYIYGKRVARRLKDVLDLISKGYFEVVAEQTAGEPLPVAERPSEPTVLGMESMIDKVWNCLVQEEVGVVGIYGMGGVGKTTLLTQINNKFVSIPHDFEVVIWVVVSKDLSLVKVQEEIARRIGLSNQEESFSEKAANIFGVLQKKKFVLLLDDIWERVELKDIGIPLPKRQNKSKIIFTTRSAAVCGKMEAEKMIKVEPLGRKKAWELFQEKVGEDTLSADPDIRPIAEDVARECCGLPLALITIGRAMAWKKTPQEWKYAVEMLRKSASNLQGMGDDVFPILKFSYDSLVIDKVKSCFLYCCLFPEDFKILKDNLIEHWIYENFWKNDDIQVDAFNEGYNIIGTLVHACLLEEEGKYIKMHDVIRDMAVWIASEVEKEKENYLVQAGAQLTKAPEIERWRRARRMSLMGNNIQDLTEVPDCPHLLTLFISYNRNLSRITSDFFQFMKALTVLDLSWTKLFYLPAGIKRCDSLQYLNLAGTSLRDLPSELLELRRLKYLNLEEIFGLHRIPRHMISSLPLLQVLRLMDSGLHCCIEDKGDVNAEELEGLEHLKVLSITIKQAFILHRFLNSNKLLSCTESLHITFKGGESQELNVDSLIEEAKTQTIGGGLCNSASLTQRCFDNLHTVKVYECHYLQDLTWLILSPNLTSLYVSTCSKLREIISLEKLGENQNTFARLKFLKLEFLMLLKSIYCKALPLPFLEEIFVLRCPLLKKLPLNSSSAKGRKVVIKAEMQWWNDVEWEDDATKTAFQSCFTKRMI